MDYADAELLRVAVVSVAVGFLAAVMGFATAVAWLRERRRQ